VAKEMLINVSEGEECRIALVEDGRLEELYMERSSSAMHVGNIYKGRVTNVEPSIQAAFIDFGLGRNGFLHITDLMPTYFGRKGEDIKESVGRKMARRDRPPIQRCLRRGDEIVVQVIKEGIGTKGPTLSSYLSIPGRILVMMPGMSKMGVSKKIEDEEERRRLRQILDGMKPPKDVGFIIRTAGVGKSKMEIQRDFTYLSRLWLQIEKMRESGPGPMELYTEGDLVTRTVRDVFTSDVERIIVDNKDVAKRVKDVIKITAPRTKNRVDLHEDPVPLFHKYGIERDIELMYSRHVPLPSGGSLVIDSTEAIVAIDVNSGKMREHADAETTAFKTDMEAADEIPRQLRLRDLGGVIICDFIDLRYERHRRELEERLHENFKNDRAKTKVLRMSQFGIIEMTRQRMRPSLKRSIYNDCPHCKGAGLVKTAESMSLDVMRRLTMAIHDQRVQRVEVLVNPEVAFYLQNKKRASLAGLEQDTNKQVLVKSDATLGLDEVKFELFDMRDGKVFLPDLGMVPEQPGQARHGSGQRPPQGRPDRGPRRGGDRPQQGQRRREAQPLEDDSDLERGEDALEDREEDRELAPAEPPRRSQPLPPPQRREAPSSYSNFTDTDVDLGEDEEEDQPPRRDQRDQRDQRGPRDQQRGPRDQQRDQRDQRRDPRDQRPQQQQPRRDDRGRPPQQPLPAQQGRPPAQNQGQGRPPAPNPGRGGPQPQGQPGQGQGAQGQGGEFDPNAPGEGGRRRRRRRRGGRGRNRNRNQQPAQDQNGQPLPVGAEGAHQPQEPFEQPEGDFDVEDQDDLNPPSREENVLEPIGEAPQPIVDEPEAKEVSEAEEAAEEEDEVEVEAEPVAEEPKPSRRRGGTKAPARGAKKKPAKEAPAKAVAAKEEPAEKGTKSRRRGSRGGRGRGKKKASDSAVAEVKSSKKAEEAPAVVRTGSTDRHQLVVDEPADEPILPTPARRPQTFRDLDEIPDDFD
jgi:ribonuclease E